MITHRKLVHLLMVSLISFVIPTFLLSYYNTVRLYGEIGFAEAWVVPHYHSRRSSNKASIIALQTSPSYMDQKYYRQSKVKRWYVHNNNDDDDVTPTEELSTSSSPTQHEKTNNNNCNINTPPKELLNLKILLIDNHDSYTYNLYQYISTMTLHPVTVIMNDAYDSYNDFIASLVEEEEDDDDDVAKSSTGTNYKTTLLDTNNNTTTAALSKKSLKEYYDCIILSPGPGRPSHSSDMGIILDVIRANSNIPILGVCLGHQALGYVYGQDVIKNPVGGPVHGLLSEVFYNESSSIVDTVKKKKGKLNEGDDDDDGEREDVMKCQLFHNLPQLFEVVRYHSLVVDFTNNNYDHSISDIEPIAWCNSSFKKKSSSTANESSSSIIHQQHASNTNNNEDTVLCMALRHKYYPHYGVQFHPESIGTGDAGYTILQNFCDFAARYNDNSREERQLPNDTKQQEQKHESRDDVYYKEELNYQRSSKKANSIEVNGIQQPVMNSNNDISSSKQTSSTHHNRVFIHKILKNNNKQELPLVPRVVFEELYSKRSNSFWLDSSTGGEEATQLNNQDNETGHSTKFRSSNDSDEGCPITNNSRFSIMGTNDGPLSTKIEYFGIEHDVQRRGLYVTTPTTNQEEEEEEEEGAEVMMVDNNMDILSYLRQQLVEEREFINVTNLVTFDEEFTNNDESGDVGYTLCKVDEFDNPATKNDEDIGESIIPFDYRGGYVGYLGYEVRHDTQCWIFQQEGGSGCRAHYENNDDSTPLDPDRSKKSGKKTNPDIPTSAFLFVDRSLVYDHYTGDWYIVGVAENNGEGDIVSWMYDMKTNLESMGRKSHNGQQSNILQSDATTNASDNDVIFVPNRSKDQYQMDISRSHEEIRNGESYELCVTNQLEAEITLPTKQSSSLSAKASPESPFELYKLLRESNPAPFSAFMNFYNEASSRRSISGSVSICCSSPERFLSVKKAALPITKINRDSHGQQPPTRRQFVIESKPIKGTAARYTGSGNAFNEEPPELVKLIDSRIAADLKDSVKDRAENLMIVDLLRNDLGRVCQVGSVHVPKLMHIESYATVHQMVSTVRGTLDGETTHAIDAIEACFPGGSMTGAPKQRTMEILDDIEDGVSRGPYSGCLGYISLNGCMDMNIVIRSAVLTPLSSTNDNEEESKNTEKWKASIGCGGAITALSDSDDEYDEMLLKSRVVRRTISDWVVQARAKRTAELEKN